MEHISIPVNKILTKLSVVNCHGTYLNWWGKEPKEIVTILSIAYPSRDFDFCHGRSYLWHIGVDNVDYTRIDELDLYFIVYKNNNKD